MKLLSITLLTLLPVTSAWTAPFSATRTPFTSLNVGAAWSLDDNDYDNVYQSDQMMHRAEVCANSDECSLEEAQVCLDEVLHIQSNCVGAGVLSTTDVCCGVETFETLPSVVDKLRAKISCEQKRMVFLNAGLHVVNVSLGTVVVAMILHGLVADPNVPVDGGITKAVVPFMPMEWVWAVRDGYLPLLMKEWMQHGGLMVDPSVFEAKAVPILGHEWMAAGDSLPRLLQEQMQYGGLRVDPDYDAPSPLQAQEWWWAVRDGYFPQAVQHVMRNGGV